VSGGEEFGHTFFFLVGVSQGNVTPERGSFNESAAERAAQAGGNADPDDALLQRLDGTAVVPAEEGGPEKLSQLLLEVVDGA
jgi:hypothetical protein